MLRSIRSSLTAVWNSDVVFLCYMKSHAPNVAQRTRLTFSLRLRSSSRVAAYMSMMR
jgi:hypothetical protein